MNNLKDIVGKFQAFVYNKTLIHMNRKDVEEGKTLISTLTSKDPGLGYQILLTLESSGPELNFVIFVKGDKFERLLPEMKNWLDQQQVSGEGVCTRT